MTVDRALTWLALGVGVYALFLSRSQIAMATPQHPAAARARAALATALGAAETDITVERIEPTVYPDASLGLPEPGRAYANVVTPGYGVVLRLGDRLYEYHADQLGQRVVLCQPCTAQLQGGA